MVKKEIRIGGPLLGLFTKSRQAASPTLRNKRKISRDVLGWAGNAVETEWVSYILGSISNKLPDIASYPVEESDLLIYDNTPLAAPI